MLLFFLTKVHRKSCVHPLTWCCHCNQPQLRKLGERWRVKGGPATHTHTHSRTRKHADTHGLGVERRVNDGLRAVAVMARFTSRAAEDGDPRRVAARTDRGEPRDLTEPRELSLEEVLKSYEQPINEEQAWAVCYQCCSGLRLPRPPAATAGRVKELSSILLHRDGTVSLQQQQQHDGKSANSRCKQSTPSKRCGGRSGSRKVWWPFLPRKNKSWCWHFDIAWCQSVSVWNDFIRRNDLIRRDVKVNSKWRRLTNVNFRPCLLFAEAIPSGCFGAAAAADRTGPDGSHIVQ